MSTKHYTRNRTRIRTQAFDQAACEEIGAKLAADCEDGVDSSDYPFVPTCSPPVGKRRRKSKPSTDKSCRRQSKKTRPISERILTAAALTGVDPVGGTLVPDDNPSARRPLPFVAANRAPSPVGPHARITRRHFVDPRTPMSFDCTAFCAKESDSALTSPRPVRRHVKKYRPITAWQPFLPADPSAAQQNLYITTECLVTRPEAENAIPGLGSVKRSR